MKATIEEQKAKAAERRERFRGLCKRLAGMSDGERAELTSRTGAVMTCEGRALSLRNTLLLMLQRGNVSVVGGFRQWIKAGRCVRKGEHGASILVPVGRGKSSAEAVHDEPAGDGEGGRVFFISGTVFDVSQTEELGGEGAVMELEGGIVA